MIQLFRRSLILIAALGVAACGGDDQAEDAGVNLANIVGLKKNPPDEFAVIPTAPLELPKDFTALPPPNPGERSRLVSDPVSDAREALLGDSAPKAANARVSTSEAALLSASGSTAASSDIRTVLDAEQAASDDAEQQYLLDRVFPTLRTLRGADQKDLLQAEEERVRLSTLENEAGRNSSGIATIQSSTGPAAAQPVSPIVTPPAVSAPTIDPSTGEELIFIPE